MEKQVFLLGVAHVLDVKRSIAEAILSMAPRAVCVELDRGRYYGLTHPEAVEESRRSAPFIYRRLAKIQKDLGNSLGVMAGEEMLSAVDAGRSVGAAVFFVDDDSSAVFRKMLKEMSVREKFRLFSALVLPSRKKASVKDELEKYEKDRGSYIDQMAALFPSVKRVLIDERNEHMAERISVVAEKFGRVAAVLGDAHLDGVAELIGKKGIPVEMRHLGDIDTDGFSVSVSYAGD